MFISKFIFFAQTLRFFDGLSSSTGVVEVVFAGAASKAPKSKSLAGAGAAAAGAGAALPMIQNKFKMKDGSLF